MCEEVQVVIPEDRLPAEIDDLHDCIHTIIDKIAPRTNSSPVYPLVMLMLFFIDSIAPPSLSIKK